MKNLVLISSKLTKVIWLSSLLLISLICSSSDVFGDLLFFKATNDKEGYAKSPQKYDRIILPGGDEIFVERIPSLRIEFKEMQSVVIEKEKVYRDTQTALEELFGMKPKGPGKQDQKESDFAYKATVYLSPKGARRFNDFAQKHNQNLFDLRLKNQRLGVPKLIGPFGDKDFTVGLAEKNVNRLKEIFSPIEEKVTWK